MNDSTKECQLRNICYSSDAKLDKIKRYTLVLSIFIRHEWNTKRFVLLGRICNERVMRYVTIEIQAKCMYEPHEMQILGSWPIYSNKLLAR